MHPYKGSIHSFKAFIHPYKDSIHSFKTSMQSCKGYVHSIKAILRSFKAILQSFKAILRVSEIILRAFKAILQRRNYLLCNNRNDKKIQKYANYEVLYTQILNTPTCPGERAKSTNKFPERRMICAENSKIIFRCSEA